MINKKVLPLFALYASYLWFTKVGTSTLPTHFLAIHISFSQMIFALMLGFIAQLILLVFLRSFSAKLSWYLALISAISYIIFVTLFNNIILFYIASFINGLALYFFFVFYNIAHFDNTPQEKRGHSSSLMFILPSIVGILAPLVSGFFTELNVVFLAFLAFISFLISFFLVNFQDDFKISYTIKEAINEIKPVRIFILLEGIWNGLLFLISIYTLYYIKTPVGYGLFISYLAIVSIIASFALGKITDRLQKRSVFLYPVTIAIAVITALFAFVKSDLTSWVILVSVIQFLSLLFAGLSMAFVVDTNPKLHLAIPARELTLAVGRITGLLMVLLSFTVEKSPFYIFIVLGLIFLVYPVLLFWNTKISKKHAYL